VKILKRLIKRASGVQVILDIVNDPNIQYMIDFINNMITPDTDLLDNVKNIEELKRNLEYIKMYGKNFLTNLLNLKKDVQETSDVVENKDEYREKYVDKINNLMPPVFSKKTKNKLTKKSELQEEDLKTIQTQQIRQILDYQQINNLLLKTKELYNHVLQSNEQETQDELIKLDQLMDWFDNLIKEQQNIQNELREVEQIQQEIINN
jgi:hypothetical protein